MPAEKPCVHQKAGPGGSQPHVFAQTEQASPASPHADFVVPATQSPLSSQHPAQFAGPHGSAPPAPPLPVVTDVLVDDADEAVALPPFPLEALPLLLE